MFEKYKPQIKEFLGCDSMVTCMAYCMNPLNIQKCQELGNKIGSSEQISNQEQPEVWCPKASPGCAWDGKQCICPGTSEIPIQTGSQEPGEVWCPKIGPYCVWDNSACTCWDDCMKAGGTWTGSRCELPQPTSEPGEVWCPRTPGCTWTDEVCQCTPVQAPQTEPTLQPAVQGVSINHGLLQQLLDFLLR